MKNQYPWRIALTAYMAGLALVGFWPSPIDRPILGMLSTVLKHLHGLGIPAWFDYYFVEASANVAMFIPLGFFAARALPRKPWWQLAAMGLVASLSIEFGQLLFITSRFSTVSDIVTNTCGAVSGVVFARTLARLNAIKPSKT
ncbi:VanZ family protein [Paenarthrobacter sp. C1]|uniref:VanZ family protein n=1 Tax=Paenarthrobacter sp. C1 TaxID=3400220 RepID=UPI003BF52820